VWICISLSLDFQDIPKNKSSMSDHPPLQQYSEHSANVAFVLAVGIMATAFFVLTVGMLVGGFYVKATDGVEAGVGAMMVICVLAVIPPMAVTLSLLGKVKTTDHH
jgi:hypothetical protein